ncbi:hypothetical protein D0T56_15150, partial [Dysgonomonas sp. 520]|nr:hypothetical protein [Dysgonomonas sp. 520]
MTRGNEDRFIQAEESAEMSIIEHLSENYEIEKELNKGKYIAGYNRAITYPVGVHIYFEDKIHEVIRPISGYKAPADVDYWEEHVDINLDQNTVSHYSQFQTYYKNEVVFYNGVLYKCLVENGFKFDNIRIPMVNGWLEAEYEEWQPVDYTLWDIVLFDGDFYTLLSLNDFDNNINPLDSDNWGAIANYDPDHNDYELSGHEYVVYNGKMFHPEIDVNADIPEVGKNLTLND